ncbi:MAG: transposase [Actinobacteria bacterium]|nr:transposase [Actinomycetota bacterium]
MCTEDFIIALFCRIDEKMRDVSKHPQSALYPGEIVTLALLFAIKGVGNRAFYRWLTRDWLALFPRLPDRTRLFRLFATHQDWTQRFMADATVLGVADTYGVELLHPVREGRSPAQIGKKGLSNKRWIVGGKLGLVLNKWGLVCAFDAATANVSDVHFRPMVAQFDQRMIVLTDSGFHGAEGDPPNMKVCKPKTWGVRMVVETVLSMLTVVSHLKKVGHRAWPYFHARLAYTMAAFNVLAQWNGLKPDEHGFVHLSIAEFSL